MVFFYIFSLMTDMIYIFTVAKRVFLDNFGTGIFYQKVLGEGYLSEITLRMFDVDIKRYDVTVWAPFWFTGRSL